MKILLVEDNANHAYLITSRLLKHGIDVETVDKAETALQAVLSGERFDAVLCDITLPGGMDGIEFVEAARKLTVFDGVRMFAISSDALQSSQDAAIAAGYNGFIEKPFSPYLASQLHQLLTGPTLQ